MGFLSRLFGPKEPVTHTPPSEAAKQAIMLLGMSRDFDSLSKSLRSKNPHVRTFTVEAVLFGSQVRSIGGGQMQFGDDTTVDPGAVRLLIPLLDDGDEQVRQATERALEKLEKRSQLSGDAAHREVARALAEYRARPTKNAVDVSVDRHDEMVSRVERGEAFQLDLPIAEYAGWFQDVFERLYAKHGSGPMTGAWTNASLSCATCNRSFPSSYKLHLTNPEMFGAAAPRRDCPSCGSSTVRLRFNPESE